tara:strand:+ start:3567 stop:3740 length:174 start_codon:yes stop_codon:yes gene_type:complete
VNKFLKEIIKPENIIGENQNTPNSCENRIYIKNINFSPTNDSGFCNSVRKLDTSDVF